MIYQIFGNTGIKGEQALINKIDEIDEGYFLVRNYNNFKSNYDQQPEETIKYVKNEFQYIGNIDFFEVYYKK